MTNEKKHRDCNKCKKNKALSEFHRDNTCKYSGGFRFTCKTCAKVKTRNWQVENPELEKKRHDREYKKFVKRGRTNVNSQQVEAS